MLVSNTLGLEVWGVYSNDLHSLLFLAPDDFTAFSSADTNVAPVDGGLPVRSLAEGTATVNVGARGFTHPAVIRVVRPPEVRR